MSDFSTAWNLSRGRFFDEVKDLSDVQLRWRMHPGSLSIGQMVLHVTGVEVSFASQLSGCELDAGQVRLKAAATQGVVNDEPFPYAENEISAALVAEAFEIAKRLVLPLISQPSPELLSKEIKSALGPMITGEGALARLAFHPAYHQGQAYLMKTSPEFPA